MRALKFATIGMGVLILLGFTVIIVTIVKRGISGPVAVVPEKAFAAVLDEPAGTAIMGIASAHDRLAIQLRGGGVDRVVVIDPVTGAVMGRVSLGR